MMHIPYETLARAEAGDILSNLPTALGTLTLEQMMIINELVADGYARGLEVGFTLSSGHDDSPGDVMEAYTAGIEQGRNETRQGER